MTKIFVLVVLLLSVLVLPGKFPGHAADLNYPFINDDVLSGTYDNSEINITNSGDIQLQSSDMGSWSGYSDTIKSPVQVQEAGTFIYNGFLYLMAPIGPNPTGTTYQSETSFKKYDLQLKKWYDLKIPPAQANYGFNLVFDNLSKKYAYYLPGAPFQNGDNGKAFFRYDLENDSWTRLTDIPSSVFTGSSFTMLGTKIYGFASGSDSKMYKYDTNENVNSDKSWQAVSNFPASIDSTYGITITSDNNENIFVLSNNYNKFYSYNLNENSGSGKWDPLSSPDATNLITYGKLVYIPPKAGNNAKIMLIRSIFNFNDTLNEQASMYKYTISSGYSGSWSVKGGSYSSPGNIPPNAKANIRAEAVYDNDDSIYALLGYNNLQDFYRYSLSAESWGSNPTIYNAPKSFTKYNFVYDGKNSAYYLGNSPNVANQQLYKLDLITNTSSSVGQLAPVNILLTTGAYVPGTGGDDQIYFITTSGTLNTQYMYKYSVLNGTWIDVSTKSGSNSTVGGMSTGGGSSMVYDSMGKFIYVVCGGSSTNCASQTSYLPNIKKYDPSTTIWSSLTLPTNVGLVNLYGTGSSTIVNQDGTHRYLYLLAGNNQPFIFKYDIVNNSWYRYRTPVGGINDGGYIVSDGSKYLYLFPASTKASNARQFYRLDSTTIDSNTPAWKKLADLPSDIGYNSAYSFYAPAFGARTNDRIYMAPDWRESYLWSYDVKTYSNPYVSSGNWYSKIYDFKQVDSWKSGEGLTFNATNNPTVTIKTQSSDNGNIWDDWTAASGPYKNGNQYSFGINSSAKRYIRVWMNIQNTAPSTTPTINSLKINYYQSTAAPNNVSTVHAYSSVDKSTSLTSGNRYPYTHPYFTWDAPTTNNSSGIGGYYVYFGPNSSADPATMGVKQTTNEFYVDYPMENSIPYYLNIKPYDNLGNYQNGASADYTYFTYYYNFINQKNIKIDLENDTFKNDFYSHKNKLYTAGDGIEIARESSSESQNSNNGVWSTGTFDTTDYDSSTDTNWSFEGGATAVVKNSDYNRLFILTGNGSGRFRSYDINSQSWVAVSDIPVSVYKGSVMVWDGQDILYVMTGYNAASLDPGSLYKYKIKENEWDLISSLPSKDVPGSDLVYLGNQKLLAIFGDQPSLVLFNENDVSKTWKTVYSLPQSAISDNATGMWFDGNQSVYIMLTNVFGVYKINTNTDTTVSWQLLSAPPAAYSKVAHDLVYDGQGNLYRFGQDMENNTNTIALKYNLAGDFWSPVDSNVYSWGYGAVTGDNQRYAYVFPSYGVNTSRIFQYDMLENRFNPSPNEQSALKQEKNEIFDYYMATQNNNWDQSNPYSASTYDGADKLYMLNGVTDGGYEIFSQYSLSTHKTIQLPLPPGCTEGTTMQYLNGYIYLAFGATITTNKKENTFYRYNIGSNAWEMLPNPPINFIKPGTSSMVTDGSNIYLPPGDNTSRLLKYDPSTSSWLSYNCTTCTISGSNIVFKLSSLYYDSTTRLIYILPGNDDNYTNFSSYYMGVYTFDPSSNIWAKKSNNYNPTISGIVVKNNKIYTVTRDILTNYSYVYMLDTTNVNNPWTDSVSNRSDSTYFLAPDTFRKASNFIDIGNNRAVGIPGDGSPGFWYFNFPDSPDTGKYLGTGNYTSRVLATDGIYDFASIHSEVALPLNTEVEFYTSTSDQESLNGTWSDWQKTEQVKVGKTITDGGGSRDTIDSHIMSQKNKFIRLKIVLKSYDNLNSPTVYNASINYFGNTDPPTNPSAVSMYENITKTGGLVDTSPGNYYNYDKPYFEWPMEGRTGGAMDSHTTVGDSGRISGYYVYFGLDPTANPSTGGVYIDEANTASTNTQNHTKFIKENLSKSGTYYFIISTLSKSGILSQNPSTFNVYHFDNASPSAPASISVTPTGYTSTNDYSFKWDKAVDDLGGSGIKEYCYWTGDNPRTCIEEDLTKDYIQVDHITKYQDDINNFYLVAVDKAGNESSKVQVPYYYSNTPPSQVINLHATVNGQSTITNSVNSFGFAWDLPGKYSGDPKELSFCYSVNVFPRADGVTTVCQKYNNNGTGPQTIADFPAATQVGRNVLYMVAMDQAGNVDWNTWSTAQFYANTVAPGAPLNIVANDTSDQATDRWSVTLTWDTPTFQVNGVDHYNIERSEDDFHFSKIGTSNTQSFVDLNVNKEKLYYYRISAADSISNAGGYSSVVSKTPKGLYINPPKFVSTPSNQTSFDRGTVYWTTSRNADIHAIYYGTQPTLLGNTQSLIEPIGQTFHNVTITGLAPLTTYYYKIQSYDTERNYTDLTYTFSDIYTFTTTEATKVQEVSSTDIGLDSAIISWKTSAPSQGKVEYSASYDQTRKYDLFSNQEDGSTTYHVMKVDNLQNGVKYHYRISAVSPQGGTVYSDDYNFTTIPLPVISTVRFQPIEGPTTAVKVSWQTNQPTDSSVSYSADSIKEKTVSDTGLVTAHEITIPDLASATKYNFIIRGRDQYGSIATYNNLTWSSGADTRAPELSNLAVEIATTGVASSGKAQFIVTWHTDEPASSQVKYGLNDNDKLDKESTFDKELTTEHTVVISDLDLSQVYRLKPESKDSSGNTGYGEETVAITPNQDTSVFDALFNLFEGFINKF